MATDHDLLLQVKARQDALERLIQEAKEAKVAPVNSAPNNTGNSTITISGGWQISLVVSAALVCLYIAADARSEASELRAEARDLGRKVERREDYLNMLWQRYPELRPEKLNEAKK